MSPTKEHIILTSFRLFLQKGYKEVTMSMLVKATGLSKGAFYHYYKSKDEVLDDIIMDYTTEVVEMLYEIAYNSSLNGLEKYKKMFTETESRRKKNAIRFSFLTRLFLNEENLLFRHRYTEKILELTKPPFIHILQQGVKEGLFIINDPEETAELIMRLGNIYRTKIAILNLSLKDHPNNLLKIQNIIEFLQDTVEKLLGLDSGVLNFISGSFQNRIKP